MAEANGSLSPNRLAQRMIRHRAAIITRARQRAKKVVLLQLRAQGLKLAQFSAKEITLLVEAELERNRARLIAEAEEAINTWPGFARWRLPVANLTSDAQTPSEPKSITSAVQNSSAEWKADQ